MKLCRVAILKAILATYPSKLASYASCNVRRAGHEFEELYTNHRIGRLYKINRDERGFPLTHYITNCGISRSRNTITHFKQYHRVLRLISNRMSAKHRHKSAVYVRAVRSKKSPFGVLFLLLLFFLLLIIICQ